ncbi:polysaccharide lyase family 8 super-sandwich domain-containing protein [Endozoicomonas elysicola]|uniref:Uncharacterized protein n=1 Tax=Endozoicomonas elysicola TaxID=305900 RepID=A0A081KFQ6_9GAMM|nr:polysaccharide lyase family 8 super-sandwich domain-containing protein [Endozoicomonas elysicola]KEI72982.1 hypothetical protein GV64_21680 [Endozoicomonas elysicola]
MRGYAVVSSVLILIIFITGCSLKSPSSDKNELSLKQNSQQSIKEQQELETIYQRYVSWTIGTKSLNKSDKIVYDYHNVMLNTFKEVTDGFTRKGGVDGLGDISFSSKKDKQPVARYVFDTLLPALSMSYAYPGLHDSPNPGYKNENTLKMIISILDHMHTSGWKKGVDTGFDFDRLRETGDTGFGGSINNNITGYSKTLLLLRNELHAVGRLERELETLDWVTRIFSPEQDGRGITHFNFSGFNSDGFKSMVRNRLSYVATQLPDDSRRIENMRFLTKFYNKSYAIAPGWADTIKPDGVGYHHKGIYGNTYSEQAFEAAARSIYLFRDTSFQVTDKSIENVKLALKTIRIYSQKYDMHRGIAGRFPEILNSLIRLLPAYAYLGSNDGLGDPEMKGIFARLWDRTYFENSKILSDNFTGKGLGAFGELEAMISLEKENALPEPSLSGHWVYPYGAMSIHRRPDWMAAVKGFSRYIWDYESGRSQNLYGGNASSGVLRLYTKGNPVNAFDSGYGIEGWDWHRLPGATTVRVPYKRMEVEHRNWSDESFVGGLSAEQANGLFAMIYDNQVGDVSLTARKSIFFFDDQIVLLGSDINGGNRKDEIATTLFQTRLPTEQTPTIINGSIYDSKSKISLTTNTHPVWLTDSVGNGYYVPNPSGLEVHRDLQVAPDSSGKTTTKGMYATAWLSHGTFVDSGSYEYVVLVNAGTNKTQQFAKNARNIYQVRQRDKRAHIVEHLSTNITGYALFEAGNAYESDLIIATDKPALAMVRKVTPNNIVLSVVNPDLELAPDAKIITFEDLREETKWLYHDSETSNVTLTLNGHWNIKAGDEMEDVAIKAKMLKDQPVTEISFTTKHAFSKNIELYRF